ncbi:sortase [Cryobacterium sp. MDB2-33-2]|uniref:sortase n=1 Tax=Cryobacterium sp. MDB2-33-2 TaxID=1259179 RepID=UPI00106A1578|nr:sortase [Cryobacterium sp. MDB2-33-2]TFC05691.1 sortase [Cryobacterium sp. MDB2-33-2]
MAKKTLAVIALAVLAVFAVPAAANAAGYVPDGQIVVSGTPAPGATVVVDFTGGSFTPGEDVSFSCTGSGLATLSVLKAGTATLVKSSTSTGAASVNVVLPAGATGSYTTTATGLTSGTVGTATITVVAADSGTTASGTGGGLAGTGYNTPVLLIWAAAGALLLGIALVVVLSFVRRRRVTA